MSLLAAVVAAAALLGGAQAQEPYPSKPVRWILPFPAGGPSDAMARVVAQRLGERLKQPVLVDNRAGAGGRIGMEAAVRAAPDGHTIVFGAPGSVVLNVLADRPQSDPLAALAGVSQLAAFPFVLIAHPGFAAESVPQLIAAAKARPGAVTCGAAAALQQLACELLKHHAGIDLTTVPYKGAAPALNDLIGGQIDFMFEVPNIALAQAAAQRVRAIATTGGKPLGQVLAVESALPGYRVEGWFGVLAPAATPASVVTRLNEELGAVLADPAVRQRLVDAGLEPVHGSPEAFAALVRADRAKYARLIRETGIRLDGS